MAASRKGRSSSSGNGRIQEMSDEVAREMREAFGYLDKDGDGQVGAEELLRAMRVFGMPGASVQRARDMIQYADGDADGWLDFGDFVTLLCRCLASPDAPGNLRLAFDLFDGGRQTGRVAAAEVAAFLTGLTGEATSEQAAGRVIAEAAAAAKEEENDGQIDCGKFAQLLMGGLRTGHD